MSVWKKMKQYSCERATKRDFQIKMYIASITLNDENNTLMQCISKICRFIEIFVKWNKLKCLQITQFTCVFAHNVQLNKLQICNKCVLRSYITIADIRINFILTIVDSVQVLFWKKKGTKHVIEHTDIAGNNSKKISSLILILSAPTESQSKPKEF